MQRRKGKRAENKEMCSRIRTKLKQKAMAADISRHTNGEAQIRISTHRCMRFKTGQLRGNGNAQRYHSCTQSKDGRGEGLNSRIQAIGEKRRGDTCIYATVSPGAPLYSLIHKCNSGTVTLQTTTRYILHTKKKGW